MAWEAPHLPLVLLLLASGSWVQAIEEEVVYAVQGQAVTVKCDSSPQEGEYKRKIWCKEGTAGRCSSSITISKPQTMAQKSRYLLCDNPAAGFFTATLIDIKKNDAGHYLCGMYPGPGDTFNVLKNVSLLVTSVMTSPASGSGSEHSLPANTFLVVLLCGLLMTKVLVVIALLMLLTYRALGYAKTVRIAAMAAPSPTKTPGPMGTPH
ncbi:trem-like transcript 4 protein [Diceros bicornis minor]|uniref:trem-like transcript 4 protein n=1 Tax=Diceros bicornis minor TaxID=77932 RepID=UPI0026EEEE6F|nr:trem-like transcript 4 protein [Diceros bicornis minor]